MFWNVIDPTRQSVLKQILESPPVNNCYLAGGTALALLLGHRESIEIPGLKIASLPDIGTMKIIAASITILK